MTCSTSAVSSGCVRFTTWSMVMVDVRLVSEDPKGLSRPVDLSAGHVPAEAAGVAQPLRLGEIRLAPSQRRFGAAELRSFLGFAATPAVPKGRASTAAS